MNTPLQEMYAEVQDRKEKTLQYYLDLEREHLIGFATDFGVPRNVAEQHFNLKYNDSKGPQTTTIRPDIPE
jgi:hypothetical protein